MISGFFMNNLYTPDSFVGNNPNYVMEDATKPAPYEVYDLEMAQLQQLQAQLQEQNHYQPYHQYGPPEGAPFVSSSSSPLPQNPAYLQSPGSTSTISNEELLKKTAPRRTTSKSASDSSFPAELTEEELQRKKKAQNRNAQRAFRERKETRLKELEAKLLQSEDDRQKLMEQLDLIRRQNITISAENEALKGREVSVAERCHFPESQDDFIENMVGGTKHVVKRAYMHKVYDSPEHGTKTLGIGALWDYLQIKAEEMGLDDGSMDVQMIMKRLRGNERCHGYGPAYPLDLVDRVIEECCSSN